MEILIIFALLFASLANASCFRPNGTSRNDPTPPDAYLPCSASAKDSMCCRTGEGGNDVCRNDGLCSNGDLLWRESCTDSTWKSDACIKLCVSDTLFSDNLPYSQTDVQITQCDDGSLCCGDATLGRPCCQQKKGVWLIGGKVFSTNPSSTSSSVSPSSTSISTSISTSASLPVTSTPNPGPTNLASNQASTSRNYTGVIAGSAVGGILFLALLVCLLWWLTFMRGKGGRRANAAELDAAATGHYDNAQKYAHLQTGPVYHEAPLNYVRSELPGSK